MATPEIDIDAISEALNDKMDRDLKNRSNDSGLRKLRESYVNGNTWYKIFTEIQSDGTIRTWCEQGGFAEPGTLISLLIPYADTTYTLTITPNGGTNGSSATTCNTYNVTSTSFYFTTASNAYSAYWKAEGYLVLNETIPTPITPVPDAPTPIETTELQLLQQQITTLQNEVDNMLGRIDYSNATSFVIYSNNGSYTIPSDGYIQLVGSNSTNTFTDYDNSNYLKFLRCVTINDKTVLNVMLPQTITGTGTSSDNTVCINSAVNTLISVSQGDIIKALPMSPASSGIYITYGYYSFYFFPQKTN